MAKAHKTSEINGEEDSIVRRARELAEGEVSLSKISAVISDETRITATAISQLLLLYNRNHVEDFIPFTQQLRAKTIGELYAMYKNNDSLETICNVYPHVSREQIIQICRSACLSEFLGQPTKYRYNEELDDASLQPEILGAEPPQSTEKSRRPKGIPSYLGELYDKPLLSFEQEQYLFRRMNFEYNEAAKLANATISLDDGGDASLKNLCRREVERSVRSAESIRNRILEANLRLVISVVKSWRGSGPRFWEMISDGNMSLIKIVDGFDYKRGHKFSTYAVQALKRNFSKSESDERKLLGKEQSGYDELPITDEGVDTLSDADADAHMQELQEFVYDLLKNLDPREAEILRRRQGIGGEEEATLKAVGVEVGVSKERVRQLQGKAIEDLRNRLKGFKLEDFYVEDIFKE